MRSPHNGAMESERHEAIGQRGEACIILSKQVMLASGESVVTYSLASGERLKSTETPGEFATMNGSRTFRLRNAAGE